MDSRPTITFGVIFIAISIISVPPSIALEAKPKRLVSINLCTDQLLLTLAPKSQILALSHLIGDSNSSPYSDRVQSIPLIQGTVEEILTLDPDLILASDHSNPQTINLLRRLGFKVRTVPPVNDLRDIETNIDMVADAIGQTTRGDQVKDRIRALLTKYKRQKEANGPVAATIWANNLSAGKGTLQHSIISFLGFQNLSENFNVTGLYSLPLEVLVQKKPDLLLISHYTDAPSLSNAIFSHPALKKALSAETIIKIPDKLWLCGSPATYDALELIVRGWRGGKR
ncbi:MAG: hypothetical protein CMQ27_01095 [Gammaproteobacteria bacterium]|nr:hypothetical protein [Gammaproteobacteria bacterium]|tara:strand:+ start:347 stop:1198 length:852 start_codon:yes stop_codon:yes gene_type:complete